MHDSVIPMVMSADFYYSNIGWIEQSARYIPNYIRCILLAQCKLYSELHYETSLKVQSASAAIHMFYAFIDYPGSSEFPKNLGAF